MIRRAWLVALASALSAAGLGLLLWLGISVALLQGRGAEMASLRPMQQSGLVFAGVLALFGIVGLRAVAGTAAGSKWRRLGGFALALALASAVAAAAVLGRQQPDPGWLSLAAALLCVGVIGAVLAAGMAMAASGFAPWRSQMVAPNFLAYAMLAGAALLFALIAVKWPGQGLFSVPTPTLIMLLVVVAALKLLYWFENGGLRTRVAGLPDQGALRQRLLVLALLALLPLALAGMLVLWPQLAPRAGWCLIALSVLAGGCLERHLLAAEAGLATRIGKAG